MGAWGESSDQNDLTHDFLTVLGFAFWDRFRGGEKDDPSQSVKNCKKVERMVFNTYKEHPLDVSSDDEQSDVLGVAIWALRNRFPLSKDLLLETKRRIQHALRNIGPWFDPESRKQALDKELAMVDIALSSAGNRIYAARPSPGLNVIVGNKQRQSLGLVPHYPARTTRSGASY